MKINIENYLHKIDTAFKEKSKKEIYMTYIMIFALIFTFSYMLFWDNSEGNFLQKRAQINSIESKTELYKRYLNNNPEDKVSQLGSETKKAQYELLILKDNNEYIKNKIETISSLIYDEKSWGEYLHSISKNAHNHNVKIIDFTNDYVLQKQSFGHILDINLKIIGSYKNTLNFINSIEQSELVVDIHDLQIHAKDNLSSDLNISVWGITY